MSVETRIVDRTVVINFNSIRKVYYQGRTFYLSRTRSHCVLLDKDYTATWDSLYVSVHQPWPADNGNAVFYDRSPIYRSEVSPHLESYRRAALDLLP
jgi:hypothetical protein